MRRALIVVSAFVFTQSVAVAGQTQPDGLAGRWAGTVDGFQGQQPAVVSFKKEGDTYSGSISGLRPGMEVALRDVKLEGEKLSAKTEFETPQGVIVVNYNFVLQGDSLKGKGETEFGGQTYSFEFDLKRANDAAGGAAANPRATAPPQPRREVPQPQQKQSLGYFVGQWSFNWIGRESALGPAPREGVTTFTLRPDGKSLEARTVGKSDNTSFNESALITWDEETKTLIFSERLANGVQVQSRGDWRSPISIRFTVDPIKVKGQTLLLKRIISVVAAHSFTVTEEISEAGGSFVRLGSAIYTKLTSAK